MNSIFGKIDIIRLEEDTLLSSFDFITVDAYRTSLDFYEKNSFRYLTTKDIDDDTRAMYFDLKAI